AAPARQPGVVVSLPGADPGSARPLPVHRAGLSRLWPLARRARLRIHARRARGGARAVRRAAGPAGRDDDGPGLGRPDRVRRGDPSPRAVLGVRDRERVGVAQGRPGHAGGLVPARRSAGRLSDLAAQLLRREDPARQRQASKAHAGGDGRLPRAIPDTESRRPMHVFPREILHSRPFLAEIERQLPKLSDRPALLVWPTKDIAFREPERKRWEQLFPNHRTVILEGAGHFIQEDAPGEIVNAIESWSPAG